MRFERFTISLLMLRPDAPTLDDARANALQDRHLAHLAGLHEAGRLLAAGPLAGPAERRLRGLSIFGTAPDETRLLAEQDPAVVAGRFAVEVMPWLVPAGVIAFPGGRLPHSVAEADAD